MNYRSRRVKIFAEQTLDSWLQDKIASLKSEIEKQTDDYLLNVNETQYIDYLVKKGIVDNLEIKFNAKFITTYEKDISAEEFPSFTFHVTAGKSYRKDIIRY